MLRSKSEFRKFLELDPTTGNFEIIELSLPDAKLAKIAGIFDMLDDDFVLVYSIDGKLILSVATTVIELDKAISAQVIINGKNRELIVKKDNFKLLQKNYVVRTHPIPGDPTPFIDNEDFDFGLFLANIISDSGRQQVALQVWGNGKI